MGFWDSIIGEEKTSDRPVAEDKKSLNPFNVSLKFLPLRLSANKRNSVDLLVKVTNMSPEDHLLSVDASLGGNIMLGFDQACINKAIEKKAGELKSGQSVELPITIWANNQTSEGNYPIDVTVYSHYIDYDKVLSYTKKSTSLRAV